MNNICTKCGVETNYDADLHCRKIFIDEIKRLLSLNEFKKARILYFAESFDIKWKEEVLSHIGGHFERLISVELRDADIRERHHVYLKAIGARYLGTSPASVTKEHRSTHCYNCKETLDNSIHLECNVCGWIICYCGACGCGYAGGDI